MFQIKVVNGNFNYSFKIPLNIFQMRLQQSFRIYYVFCQTVRKIFNIGHYRKQHQYTIWFSLTLHFHTLEVVFNVDQ